MLPLFQHRLYTDGLDPKSGFPRERYEMLVDSLQLDGGLSIEIRESPRADLGSVLAVHCPEYVERFMTGALTKKEETRIGLRPWKPEIVDRTMHLVGGSLAALEETLRTKKMAGNLAGGTHHAFHDAGSGYCIFNDLVICAEEALSRAEIDRVLVLDLDVHQGDGTARMTEGDDRIFTCSIHGEKNFPARKAVSDLDVGLPSGTEDHEYLDQLDSVLDQLTQENFDLILFQAGVDGLAEDRLGLLELTRAGLRQRNERVFDFREHLGVPMVLFMGGGYSVPIERTVEAFVDLYLAAARRSQ